MLTCSYGGMGEHYCGHILVIRLRIRHAAIEPNHLIAMTIIISLIRFIIVLQPVRKSSPCGDGHRSELHLSAHIPQGEHPARSGILISVHQNIAVFIRLHTHRT